MPFCVNEKGLAVSCTGEAVMLAFLVVLVIENASDSLLFQFNFHFIRYPDGNDVILNLGDPPVNTANRHNTVVDLDGIQHLHPLFLLLLLRPDHQEIDDTEKYRQINNRSAPLTETFHYANILSASFR